MIEDLGLRLTPLCFIAALAASALAVVWGAAVIAVSLAAIALYAIAPDPSLVALHDRAGEVGAALVAIGGAVYAARRALG